MSKEKNIKNVYKYALVLARDRYVDLETFEAVVQTKRSFRIFEWREGMEITDYSYRIGKYITKTYEVGYWHPFLFYDGKKWHNIAKSKKRWKHHSECKIMMPAHRFFKDEEELKQWLTLPLYTKLFIDLI